MAELIDQIRDIVGERGVVVHEDLLGRSAGFRHPNETLQAKFLVRPANTDEVSKVLKLCNDAGQAVVSRIYTDLAVINITPQGFEVIELAPGLDFDTVQQRTDAILVNNLNKES